MGIFVPFSGRGSNAYRHSSLAVLHTQTTAIECSRTVARYNVIAFESQSKAVLHNFGVEVEHVPSVHAVTSSQVPAPRRKDEQRWHRDLAGAGA